MPFLPALPSHRPGFRSLALATSLGLMLTACAPLPQKPQEVSTAVSEAATDSAEATPVADAAEAKPVANLPAQELTGATVYEMLLAEIALRRGRPAVAISAYADLAQSTKDPRIVRRAVELAAIGRQTQLELELSQLWVELEPDSLRARQMLVGGLVTAGRMEDAEPHVVFLLEKDPSHVGSVLMRLARSAAADPRKKELAAMLDRLAAKFPDVPEAHFVRAYAALSAGDSARALEEVEKGRTQRPTWEPLVLLNAQLLQEKEGLPKALKFLGEFLEKYPKAREVRQQYARALASEKKYAAAQEQFRILDQERPGNSDINHALAVLAVQLGDLDEADKRFRTLLDDGEGEGNGLRLALGQIAEARKKPDEALKWYEAVTKGPQYLEARLKAAVVISRQKDTNAALAYLKALHGEDSAERVRIILAQSQLLRAANRDKEAFRLLNKGLETYPDEPDFLYDSALLAEKVGHFEVLEPRLKKLIQIKPEFAHAYNALGYSLADRGERLPEAEALVRKALELAPDDPFILDSLGWVLYRKGHLEEARQTLEKSLALRPDPEIAAHLGEVQWMAGKHEDATRTWREAAKATPDNPPLQDVMKKFLGRSAP
jgi:Flp pilus assembly protein TadD